MKDYKALNDIVEFVGYLKKEMKEKGYSDDYIESVITNFRGSYDGIMNSDIELIYDYMYNGNYIMRYHADDFGNDEDLYNSYVDVFNCIVFYCTRYIDCIKTIPEGYKIEFTNGEKAKIVMSNNYTDITPLKTLYNRFIYDKGGE